MADLEYKAMYFQSLDGYIVTLQYNKWINENCDPFVNKIVNTQYQTSISGDDRIMHSILVTYIHEKLN